jgi:DNA repair protein RadC
LELLGKLKAQMPEIWDQAEIVGKWVWLEFSVAPVKEVREQLKQLGFHWNGARKCWQHPCGESRGRSGRDPRGVYPVVPATALQLQEVSPSAQLPVEAMKPAKEYKVVALRECPLPEGMHLCDTPESAAEYWRATIATNPYFNPETECLAVLMVNTRRRVKGHQLLTIGTLDSILVHPREVFRAAIIVAAAAVVIMHNHPSGEPEPSEADIKVTRDLIRAGQLMKIEVLDHVIMGRDRHCSLRTLGYFYS